jgi:hypothetical protein
VELKGPKDRSKIDAAEQRIGQAERQHRYDWTACVFENPGVIDDVVALGVDRYDNGERATPLDVPATQWNQAKILQ